MMSQELLVEVDRTWPTLENGAQVGIKDGSLVPAERLESPDRLQFNGEYTVLTAGWINAHAHLELSGVGDIDYNGDFVDWIYEVLEFKLAQEKQDIQSAYRSGCEELIQSGVCRVLDHCDRTEWILDVAEGVAIDARPLKELIGFLPEQIDEEIEAGRQFLETLNETSVNGGLAPHAPYSAHPEIYERARELTEETGSVLSTHLHETEAELEFALESTGRFQDLLEDRTGSRRESPFEDRPIGELAERGVFSRPNLGVHMNYIDDADVRWLEGHQCYPTFCPRSYDYFRHDTLPVTTWNDRDIPFCLGTDSLASNDGLNMLDELKRLHTLAPDLSAETILEALTVNPARVMGEPDRGELTYGTPADLSIFEVPSGDVEDLARGQARPLAVLLDGEVKWRAE